MKPEKTSPEFATSALYTGFVRHRRKAGPKHAFQQRIAMLYLDLDDIESRMRERPWLCGEHKAALIRFEPMQHLRDRDRAVPLSDAARQVVVERLGFRPAGPICLLTQAGTIGFRFNPISVFYCFAADGETLEALVIEVTSTPWREQCLYVHDCRTDSRGRHRFSMRKAMHVSPFLPMPLRYDFTITTPATRLVVDISVHDGDAKTFDATLTMRRLAWNHKNLITMLIRNPVGSLSGFLNIHWQALLLWARGARVFVHPGRKEAC